MANFQVYALLAPVSRTEYTPVLDEEAFAGFAVIGIHHCSTVSAVETERDIPPHISWQNCRVILWRATFFSR